MNCSKLLKTRAGDVTYSDIERNQTRESKVEEGCFGLCLMDTISKISVPWHHLGDQTRAGIGVLLFGAGFA